MKIVISAEFLSYHTFFLKSSENLLLRISCVCVYISVWLLKTRPWGVSVSVTNYIIILIVLFIIVLWMVKYTFVLLKLLWIHNQGNSSLAQQDL